MYLAAMLLLACSPVTPPPPSPEALEEDWRALLDAWEEPDPLPTVGDALRRTWRADHVNSNVFERNQLL